MRTVSLAVAALLVVAGVGPAVAVPTAQTVDGTASQQAIAGGGHPAAGQPECSFPTTGTDATGTDVTVPAEPERIAVLGPSAAQTLWEVGARDRVVAVPHQFAGYLDGVEETTDVSGPGQSYVSVEEVINTTPDLVLAPNVITDDTVSKLRDAGLTVYKFGAAATIEDVYAKTVLTGQLVGECEGAAETVTWMQRHVAAIEAAVADEEAPGVLVSLGGGFVAGDGTFVHEIVTTAGTENVAAAANVSGYRELSGETVVAQDPDWILQNGPFAAYPRTGAYNSTTAVEQGQVLTVDPNYASQPAPRIVYAIENVTKAIHPGAYEEAMASLEAPETTTTAADETTTAAAESTTTSEPTTATTAAEATDRGDTTTSGGQPGFGVPVAVLAMLSAGLVASRRR